MIKEKDVIRMKVPFPNTNAGLALQSHMYICGKAKAPDYGFIKCQTLKPFMLNSDQFVHYIDEAADINRNPFQWATRIDCDKLFTTQSVSYNDRLKTISRSDVCQALFDDVIRELNADGFNQIAINEIELVSLNYLITMIKT